MNKLLTLMTLRNIRKNFVQYLSVIIINMLAVVLFCGFISSTQTLRNTIDKYFGEANMTDLTVQVSAFDEADKQFLSSLEGATCSYRLYLEGRLNQRNAKIYVSDGEISKPIVITGERGVLLDKLNAKTLELEAGDDIEIELAAFGTYNFKITGTMCFSEVANAYDNSPVCLTEAALLAKLRETNPYISSLAVFYNQAVIKTENAQAVKTQIQDYFGAKTNSNLLYVFDRDSMESVVMLEGEATQSLKMIYVFPVIFLLVSALVIMTTISQLILRERTNIGTLKGLGIGNKKIIVEYASIGGWLCFLGSVLGAVLSPLIVPKVMFIKYTLVYSLPYATSPVFSPLWCGIAVFTVTLLAFLIGILVCKNAVRENPAQCMRPAPPNEKFTAAVARKEGKRANVRKSNMALSFKMAMRNIAIKPSRAIMTIIGITGCVALLLCGFGIGDTVDKSVSLELDEQFNYDVGTTYTQTSETALFNRLDELKAEGKVYAYQPYEVYYMTATGDAVKDVKVYNLPDGYDVCAIKPQGKALISTTTAEALKVKKGDTLLLTAGARQYSIKIDELIETAFTKGIFINTDDLSESYHTLNAWITCGNANETVDEVNLYNGTMTATTQQSIRESADKAVSSIRAIKLTLMLFAIALSVVVLYNLSLLNIKERTREIATLKVLGFTRRQISASLLYEIMLLTLIGTTCGLALGFPVLYLVMVINKVEVLNFIYHIGFISYALSALISLVTSLAINLVFGRMTGKINMIESLKSIE